MKLHIFVYDDMDLLILSTDYRPPKKFTLLTHGAAAV